MFFFFPQDSFLQLLNELALTIGKFINEFESHHLASILDFELNREAMVEMGCYFLCGVLRLNFKYQIAYEQFDSSVILKIPQLGAFEKYGRCMGHYNKEKYVYERVIPLIYDSWSGEKMVPHIYVNTESGILVLENLHESGFYPQKRGSLLDLEACKVVLKALAQFHALSIKHIVEVVQVLIR